MSKDNEMISNEEFLQLRKDVKDIKGAILGNPKYGQKGIIARVEAVESDVDGLKNFKNKIVYWTAGAAAVATVAINWLMSYLG